MSLETGNCFDQECQRGIDYLNNMIGEDNRKIANYNGKIEKGKLSNNLEVSEERSLRLFVEAASLRIETCSDLVYRMNQSKCCISSVCVVEVNRINSRLSELRERPSRSEEYNDLMRRREIVKSVMVGFRDQERNGSYLNGRG